MFKQNNLSSSQIRGEAEKKQAIIHNSSFLSIFNINSELGPAAITYNPSQNRITVTEGTADSPDTFTDIYNADKAGTLDLITRTGVAGVDSSPVDNTYNLRPRNKINFGYIYAKLITHL